MQLTSPRRRRSETRTKLIEAAAQVVHRQGFHRTTLADIAREAKFPLGNLYYYFKTKEDICGAILDAYEAQLQAHFDAWDRLADPRSRLYAFVEMIGGMREVAARSGCPFGTLSSELGKEGAPLAEAAARLFRRAIAWLEAQFRVLGKGKASKGLATHVVAVWQGSLFLAHAFGDPGQARLGVKHLTTWIGEQT